MKKMVIMAMGMLMASSVVASENTNFTLYTTCLKNSDQILKHVTDQKVRSHINVLQAYLCQCKYFNSNNMNKTQSVSPAVNEMIKAYCLQKISKKYPNLYAHEIFKQPDFKSCMNSTTKNVPSPAGQFIEWITKQANTLYNSYSNAITQLNEKSGVTVSK